jgi:transcription elongation GreA/GreB family factor
VSDTATNSGTVETPAPSAASRRRLEAERDELQVRLQDLTVRADELSGPGDSVDHALALERQFEQEHVRAQLNSLEQLLSLPPRSDDIPDGIVVIGSNVRLAFPGGDEQTLLLASIEEADDTRDVLTFDSPLGRALIGAQVGDEVEYTAPAGSMKVRVVSIEGSEAA